MLSHDLSASSSGYLCHLVSLNDIKVQANDKIYSFLMACTTASLKDGVLAMVVVVVMFLLKPLIEVVGFLFCAVLGRVR